MQSRQRALGNSLTNASCLPPFAYCLLLSAKKPGDIVVEGVNHDHDQDKNSDLLGPFSMLQFDWATQNPLQEEKEQVSTIQHGYRQKIQYSEVNAQYGDKKEKASQTLSGLLTRHLRDQEGSPKSFWRNLTFDHLEKGNQS